MRSKSRKSRATSRQFTMRHKSLHGGNFASNQADDRAPMNERYLCLHAHFYQPPRENPWLEAVELQDSAYPFHDWNERITAECYAPNSASRILSGDRIVNIVSNYSRISFNFGPTLLSWMEQNAQPVYAAILDADRDSAARFGGHGSAMAQVYNHMILPLASRADKETQVQWGIRDFEKRFARKPEGMWLAETAVDLETLEVLAEAGIKFTVLAPHQAARVRAIGAEDWNDVGGARIDPTMPYVQRLPSGREIGLFFYDGPISRAVAFEGLLSNGEKFANRLLSGFPEARERAALMHIATDGETYGHHHKYGDMALAYALHHIESNGLAQLTNYGEFLEKFPPACEVEIVENTSWSCAHGVERWRSDCGCNTGGRPGWNQQWRAPLRATLDWLRDTLAPLYDQAARELLLDPARARNDYIDVVLDRSPESVSAFFARHARRPLSAEERTRALRLLEMQRHAMLMYTSCGWFFDELSGIETVQVIFYAGRAIQLAQRLFGDHLEEDFENRLSSAKSNLPEHGDAREIYRKWVKPATVDLQKVAAHYAISLLFSRHPDETPTYCYAVARMDFRRMESGRSRLAIGRALITSRITEDAQLLTFGVLHLGDNNVIAGVRPTAPGDGPYQEFAREAREVFSRADLPATMRLLDRQFAGATYSLKSLFRDEQRRIVDIILQSILQEAEGAYRQIYEHHAPLMRFLNELTLPMPQVLLMSAEFVVNAALRRQFSSPDPDLDRIRALLEAARADKIALDDAGLSYALKKSLDRLFASLLEAPTDLGLLNKLVALISVTRSLPFEVDLWRVQNIFHHLLRNVYPAMRELDEEEARAWTSRFEQLGEKLSFEMTLQQPAAAA